MSDDSGDTERKVALVTGGARRVGAATALRLAEAGYDIAITYRASEDEAQRLVERVTALGRRACAIRVDLADDDADAQVFDAFSEHFARLDALVNNASVFAPSTFGEIDRDTYDRFQKVNARAPLMLTQRFAPWLAAHHDEHDPTTTGRIVNFVDIHVMGEPMPGYAAYNASKAALLELTRTSAVSLGPAVTVNAIAPGVVAWASDFSDDYKQRYLARTPLKRAGTPDDAADAVRWLVREAHYCTGEVIRIDGGRSLR